MIEKKIKSKYGDFTITIDDEDLVLFQKYDWHIAAGRERANGEISYMLRSTNRNLLKKYNCTSVFFHKLIKGDMDKKFDFVDGNALNLQKINIRESSRQEDARNSKTRIQVYPKSSKFKGVCFLKEKNKWRAEIKIVKGKSTHIGDFLSEIEAAIQYNYFANLHFKEFARLNIIPEFEIQPLLDEKNQIISHLKRKLAMIRSLLNGE